MPTTFTHDLFGREVYRKLPAPMKEKIRSYGNLYRIGLHGPDILFYFRIYKNAVNQFGVKMHQEKARAFFEQGMETVRKDQDDALLVYLLGFACHYILDSVSHPVVERIVQEEGPSHTLQEKELDRYLMEREGLDPFAYYPSDCIVPKKFYAEEIHKVIPLIPAKKIYQSLVMMKWTTNKMVYDDHGRRQKILLPLFALTGQKEILGDHFMRKDSPKGIQVYLDELLDCYEKALSEAPGVLKEFYACAQSQEPIALSSRFDRTYNG